MSNNTYYCGKHLHYLTLLVCKITVLFHHSQNWIKIQTLEQMPYLIWCDENTTVSNRSTIHSTCDLLTSNVHNPCFCLLHCPMRTEWSTPKIYNTLHFYLPNLIFVCHIKYAALNQVCLLSFIVFQYVWWVKHTWIDLVEWVRVEPLCCEFQQWVKRSAGQKTSQFRVFLQRRDQLSGESLLHRQNLKHIRYYTSTSHRQQKIYTLQLFSNITILPFFNAHWISRFTHKCDKVQNLKG